MNNNGAIIVIGASSGIGRAIAEIYARRGRHVAICARREDALRKFTDKYPGTRLMRLDVTSDDAATRFNELCDSLGTVDTVVYAAGCGWNNPQLDEANDNRTLQTNIMGFTTIVNAIYKRCRDHNIQLQLCAITSIAGTKGIGISATYSASKRYETTYLQAIRQLAHTQGVKLDITDIRPGFVDTDLLSADTKRRPLVMNVDYVAPRIVRAINRHRKIVYIDWRWHAVVALWRLIPGCFWRRIRL